MDLISFVASRFIEHLGDLAVMLALIALFAALEHSFPAERGQSMRGRVRNLGFVALFQLGGGVFVSVIAYLVLPYVLLPSDPLLHRSALEQAALIALYLFVGDAVFYWYHRAQHSIAALWTIHELHHSDSELNASSSFRTYLLERPVQLVAISLPISYVVAQAPLLESLRLTAEDAGRLYLVSLGWLFLAHANLRMQLGRWSWVATGPQVHRIHHSIDPDHQGKNFAQFFPVLDVIFGTYRAPLPGEFPRTGTSDMASDTPMKRALVRPFHHWFARRVKIVNRHALRRMLWLVLAAMPVLGAS
jgi:sterol desaturase/sphingolipid hydroxylase (fatty acid hydroxylase superfamily)